MRILAGLCFFYQKLLISPLIISILLSLLFMPRPNFFMGTGIAFIFLLPTLHYFTYEIRKPGEYYFYYNLGLSKLTLWATTIGLASITGILLMLL